jgi:hypothetical protein
MIQVSHLQGSDARTIGRMGVQLAPQVGNAS